MTIVKLNMQQEKVQFGHMRSVTIQKTKAVPTRYIITKSALTTVTKKVLIYETCTVFKAKKRNK